MRPPGVVHNRIYLPHTRGDPRDDDPQYVTRSDGKMHLVRRPSGGMRFLAPNSIIPPSKPEWQATMGTMPLLNEAGSRLCYVVPPTTTVLYCRIYAASAELPYNMVWYDQAGTVWRHYTPVSRRAKAWVAENAIAEHDRLRNWPNP